MGLDAATDYVHEFDARSSMRSLDVLEELGLVRSLDILEKVDTQLDMDAISK